MEQLVIENLNDDDARLIKELLKKFKNVKFSSLSTRTNLKKQDTYPYKPQVIKYDNHFYDLAHKLESAVSYEDGNYLIRNDEFDITVWGETREKAEEAFAFNFHSLYTNFAIEKDDKLSSQAMSLKKKLRAIVKSVLHNEVKKK